MKDEILAAAKRNARAGDGKPAQAKFVIF